MTIVLHSKPATAEDAAEILGVSKSRVKWLKALVHSRHAVTVEAQRARVSKNGVRAVSAKRRKKVRGKAKKVAH